MQCAGRLACRFGIQPVGPLQRLPQTGAILFGIGIYVEPLGKLSPANIAMLGKAVQHLLNGEGDRRGAPAYDASLIAFAQGHAA